MGANDTQVGGGHYKADQEDQALAEMLGYNKPVEHWDMVTMRRYNYLQGNASKYLDRYEKKGTPVQDLEKAKHYIEKLIEIETAKAERARLAAEAKDALPKRRR